MGIPEYAKESIKYFIDNGFLNGNNQGLDLSLDMIRLLVIIHRVIKKGVI